MAKKAAAKKPTAAEKKQHDRQIKNSEADRIEKGRKLAASYLEQRDGMDPETARMVVDSMEPEQIYELITEANSAVIARTKPEPGPFSEGSADVVQEWTEVPVLANAGGNGVLGFAELVVVAIQRAKDKNEAEKEYKKTKQDIMYLMAEGKVRDIKCMDAVLTVYPGVHRSLNADKIKLYLVEKGIDSELVQKAIAQGWDETPWTDVRITVPKE